MHSKLFGLPKTVSCEKNDNDYPPYYQIDYSFHISSMTGSFFLRVGVTPEEYLDKFGDVNNACHLYFNSGDVNPANYDHRNRAFAVRLVTESK